MAIDPQSILSESQSYSNTMKSDLNLALNDLDRFINGALDYFNFGNLPAFQPPELLTSLDQQPSGTDAAIYVGHTYDSAALQSLLTTLQGILSSGGTYMSADVQTAMFNRMRERDNQALQDSLDAARGEDAETFGFPIQSSMTAAKEQELIKKFADTYIDRNSEITVIIADMTQKAIQSAAQQIIGVEDIHSRFSQALFQLADSKYKTDAEVLTERGRMNISQLQTQTQFRLEALKTYADVVRAALASSLLQTNGVAVVTSKA